MESEHLGTSSTQSMYEMHNMGKLLNITGPHLH
jgi:hypothetical protein